MPRDITITFEDGSTHVYRQAPDNVTPEQVTERASKEFGKGVTSLDGGRASTNTKERTIGNIARAGLEGLAQQTKDLAGGFVRGAGSIGATILAPQDALNAALLRARGVDPGNINAQRRTDMTSALESMGADPSSMTFGAGKLGGEIAGTAGVGGALAPAFSRVAPSLAPAVSSAGFQGASMPIRVTGGAITGGAAAGLVNPEDAGLGALIGGAAPVVTKVAGAAGGKLGEIVRGPQQSQDMAQAIQSARQSGYVIPPTQAKPTFGNRVLEGFSGKLTTAQNASAKNQAVTNAKAATALGLPADSKITPDVLKTVRDQAGQAYDALGSVGSVTPGKTYDVALDAIAAPFIKAQSSFPGAKTSPVVDLVESLRTPSFDAAAAIEKIKQLRTASDDAFRTGSTDIGRASRSAAKALEDAIEAHLQSAGNTQLLNEFRQARQLIAKTYSVEKALNPTTGSIDAKALASQLKRGKPLSGDLKDVAEFAARFPKAAQQIEGMGSLPQMSPLDWALGAGMSASTANPLMLASVAARPAARALTLSPMVQNRLISSGQNPLLMLANPDLAQLGYRAAPVFGSQ